MLNVHWKIRNSIILKILLAKQLKNKIILKAHTSRMSFEDCKLKNN